MTPIQITAIMVDKYILNFRCDREEKGEKQSIKTDEKCENELPENQEWVEAARILRQEEAPVRKHISKNAKTNSRHAGAIKSCGRLKM